MILKEFLELDFETQKRMKNTFLGYAVNKNIVKLYYHLTPAQRYSQHKKAANKKMYELLKTKQVPSGHYKAERIVFEFEHAHNLCTYKYVR